MASPLGVSPTNGPDHPSNAGSFNSTFSYRSFKKSLKGNASTGHLPSASEELKPSKKHQKSLSSKTFITNKRARAGSSPGESSCAPLISESSDLALKTDSSQSFDARGGNTESPGRQRPRHIPIHVPNYEPINSPVSCPRSGSFSTWISNDSEPSTTPQFLTLGNQISNEVKQHQPKHVEIKIPSYAQPVVRQPEGVPRLSLNQSIFDALTDVTAFLSADSAEILPASSSNLQENMESSQLRRSNPSNGGSQSYLASANSSQSSLVSQHDDYESASEAETTADEETSSAYGSSSQLAGRSHTGQTTPGSQPSNLSGLVCNVHRTTGKEPHPLVGATTTVLGDKLYVFGGRRLSRSKPQLTSSLYELDLIRRHWTRLEVTGDVPAPRYFHSVCALGDTKLVCYGGMSPSPSTAEVTADGQPEVIVMSDVHIYDVPTRTWMRINTPDAPQGRYAHCAAILPSSAVFASANAPLSAVHHNPAGENPNQGSIGITLDGSGGAEMVVVGGQDSANHYIEQVSVFNLRSLKWTGTTGMGRSCGAYRSVVTPLTSMSASQIGAGPHAKSDLDEDDEEPATIGSGAPMLIYSNYNFLDVKLELQVRLIDGTLTEKAMQTNVSPPGLRFPNGGIIANHFVVSGTFLTSSKQEYALWALDLRTLTWSRIDAGGSIFSQGSWNRGVLWSRRNAFVILGNRKRSLVDDYNNRRINFSNICLVELEAFGLYDNPRTAAPTSSYLSTSSVPELDAPATGSNLSQAAEELGQLTMNARELADMDFLAIDGTRIPVNSRLITRRWGPHFTNLLRESLALSSENDTSTLGPSFAANNPSRNSSITITPSVTSGATTLTANSGHETLAPPATRPRVFYLPHTAPTLQALLHYLYTATLPYPPHHLATPQILCSLLQLARPYKIDGLLEAVVERLHISLNGHNAAAIFNAAAMGAGGGDGVHFLSASRDTTIPVRGTSLAAGLDGMGINGTSRAASALRIDTEMANGRSTRNTLRPGQILSEEGEDEAPGSATTDTSASDFDGSSQGMSARAEKEAEIWNGSMSAVVGLQKRGLRGLMEGRRLRERGRGDGQDGKVGLGIA